MCLKMVKHNVVVIPVYKPKLTGTEMKCFINNCIVLGSHKIILVAPNGLDVSFYTNLFNVGVVRFPSFYFNGINGYNKLLLSKRFYSKFKTYKFILICQNDVFVFRDDLDRWCERDYDYIGASWINKPFFLFQYVLVKMGVLCAIRLLKNNIFRAVGNGGFSLRKTSAFISASNNKLAKKWSANEDIYWSFFAGLRKPTTEVASLFSIELDSEKIMKRQKVLPMGVHAFERYEPEFWKQYIMI